VCFELQAIIQNQHISLPSQFSNDPSISGYLVFLDFNGVASELVHCMVDGGWYLKGAWKKTKRKQIYFVQKKGESGPRTGSGM